MQDQIIFKGGEHPKDYLQYLGGAEFLVSSHEIATPFSVAKEDGQWVAKENEVFTGGKLANSSLIEKLDEAFDIAQLKAFEGLYNPFSNSMKFNFGNNVTATIRSDSFYPDSIAAITLDSGESATTVYAMNEDSQYLTWREIDAKSFSLKEVIDGKLADIPPEAEDVITNAIREAAPYIVAVSMFNRDLDEMNEVHDFEDNDW